MSLAYFEVWQGKAPARWHLVGRRGDNPVYKGLLSNTLKDLKALEGVVFSVILPVESKWDFDGQEKALTALGVVLD